MPGEKSVKISVRLNREDSLAQITVHSAFSSVMRSSVLMLPSCLAGPGDLSQCLAQESLGKGINGDY